MKTTVLALLAAIALSSAGAYADDNAAMGESTTGKMDSTTTTKESPDGSKTTVEHKHKMKHHVKKKSADADAAPADAAPPAGNE